MKYNSRSSPDNNAEQHHQMPEGKFLSAQAEPMQPTQLWSDLTMLHAQLNVMQPVKDALGSRLSRAIELSPPELLARGSPLSAASDVYTFGLLMVEIILGAPMAQRHQSDRDLAMVSAF